MKLHWKYTFLHLLFVAGAIDVNSQTQREEIVHSAVTAWDQQRAHLKTVRLKFSGNLTWTPLVPDSTTRRTGHDGKVNVAAVIDFVNDRFRISMDRDDYNNVRDKIEHYNTIHVAADGTLKSQVLPGSSIVEGRTENFIIQSGGSNAISSGPLDLPFWRPILLGAGIVVPKARITWAKFAPANNSDVIHQFDGYETNTPNRAAILIRNLPDQDMRTEYWVDPDRDFVITKFLLQASGYDGAVSKSLAIDYRTVGGTWFPVAWRATNSSVDLRYTEDIQVSEIVINGSVSDEEFRLELEAGMKVYAADVQVSNRVITVATENYQVGPGNQKAGLVTHTRVYGKPRVPDSSSRQSHWFRFAFLGFLMASGIFLLAAAALRRAKRK